MSPMFVSSGVPRNTVLMSSGSHRKITSALGPSRAVNVLP